MPPRLARRRMRPLAHGKPWTATDDERLRELWAEGKTIVEPARALEREAGAVSMRRWSLFIDPRPRPGSDETEEPTAGDPSPELIAARAAQAREKKRAKR